jgi:hypothetical protein
MTESVSERRMAENEVVFRNANEAIQAGFDKLTHMSREDGAEPIGFNPTMKLQFLCECADENCVKRIEMQLDEYNEVHSSPKRFIIANNHEVLRIENVIESRDGYAIVEKHDVPPQDATSLNITNIRNVE